MVIPPGRMAVVKFFLMIQNIKKRGESLLKLPVLLSLQFGSKWVLLYFSFRVLAENYLIFLPFVS